MKIQITACGKLKDENIKSLMDEYIKRTPWNIKIIEVDAASKNKNPEVTKLDEEKLLLEKTPENFYKICLDETGKTLTSTEFASLLAKISTHHSSNVAFLLGGADGHTEKTRKSCQAIVSLGKMTYPHMLARLLLIEQLYRSYTILEGKSYHK